MESKAKDIVSVVAVVAIICVLIIAGYIYLGTIEEGSVTETVTVACTKDNTLIQNETGELSNGLGTALFIGRTNQKEGKSIRRGLVEFDLSEIPDGAEIDSVELVLYLVKTQNSASSVSVHRVNSEWGESTSLFEGGTGAPAQLGDATWLYTYYPDQNWSTPGGDYVFAASATASTPAQPNANITWNTTGLVSDVQAWLDDPSTNHGWILKGDETSPQTSISFASKDYTVGELRPRLKITYTIG